MHASRDEVATESPDEGKKLDDEAKTDDMDIETPDKAEIDADAETVAGDVTYDIERKLGEVLKSAQEGKTDDVAAKLNGVMGQKQAASQLQPTDLDDIDFSKETESAQKWNDARVNGFDMRSRIGQLWSREIKAGIEVTG